ncbi:MAG TPA: hypothetical protein VME63_16465 [Dyella sp.]|uniref:hypothetical protein n=1 Tax=Dyella sp. TaxID=1869338 RepID=UPI002C054E13|nr:hypothetical protein [Dyella sp.]HTV86995.1 hypothetical protein [Dyella sp.]
MRKYARVITVSLAMAVSSLLAACAPNMAAPKAPPPKPALDMFRDKQAYMEQYFSPDVLPDQVTRTLATADAKPVSFSRLMVTSHRRVFANSGQAPTAYEDRTEYENAGNGLVRMMVTVQSNGFDVSTDFSLSYRAYIGLLLQAVPSSTFSLPPVIEARSVEHFDPVMSSDNMNYAFHSGYVGNSRASSPYQMHCQAGRSYSAAVINASIRGMARQMQCQITNTNGIITQSRTYGYLEQYGVAIMLHSKTAANEQNVDVTDFKVE